MSNPVQAGTPDQANTCNDLLQKAWENAREIICNESDLINHRGTINIAIQGFLFAALVAVIDKIDLTHKSVMDLKLWVYIALLLVFIFIGFFSTFRCKSLIKIATRQIKKTSEWWYNKHSVIDYPKIDKLFPEKIIGEGKIRSESMMVVENILMVTWGVIFIVYLAITIPKIISCYESTCWQSLAISQVGTKNVTKIIINEDRNNKNVSISFDAALGKIHDLEEIIKVIPK